MFDHQPVSSSLRDNVWPSTSFFVTFRELLDFVFAARVCAKGFPKLLDFVFAASVRSKGFPNLDVKRVPESELDIQVVDGSHSRTSPQVFSKWLHKSSFHKGSKKGKNIQVVHGSHVQPTRLRAMPLASCHITTYEPWRKNCQISTETFTFQFPCIYVILSYLLIASHTQLWLNRYVAGQIMGKFQIADLCMCVEDWDEILLECVAYGIVRTCSWTLLPTHPLSRYPPNPGSNPTPDRKTKVEI